MSITHAEARRLIQFSVDANLKAADHAQLSAHLDGCRECRTYAAEVADVERILVPLMKGHWNLQPLPLSIRSLRARTETKLSATAILTIRRAAITLVLTLFMLSAWQFVFSGNQIPGPSTAIHLPVQTPSIQSTSTEINFENCATILYTVQANDTLASIAERFSVPKEAIVSLNGMNAETLHTTMTLAIPVCRLTPTSTLNPIGPTTTYTPVVDPATLSTEPSS